MTMPALVGRRLWLVGLLLFMLLAGCSQEEATPDAKGAFRVALPPIVLADVPVDSVRIEALTSEGEVDTERNGEVALQGVRVVEAEAGTDPRSTRPDTITLEEGVFEFSTQLASGRRIYLDDTLLVGTGDEATTVQPLVVSGFWSLLPPIVAIAAAILLKDVYVALLAAVISGALVLSGGDLWAAFVNTLDQHLLGQAADPWNMSVILFTLFLGAMISLMSSSGGTQAVVDRLARYTSTRERGQLLTWFLGLMVFFDDYANTMLVGGAMRPVSDRLRISREKLAFLIDSTAAPIAGLAIVSTWVGVEVSYINEGFSALGATADGYTVFLKTLPYRFYPLLVIFFVMLIAATGRDYGAMLRAERKALSGTGPTDSDASAGERPVATSVWYAIVPIGVLIGWIAVGFALASPRLSELVGRTQPVEGVTAPWLSGEFDSVPLLLQASFAAALSGWLLTVCGRALNVRDASEAWSRGMSDMFPAIVVLVLAWTVSSICKPGGLNTASYIIELCGDGVSAAWLPTLAFVISGVVAFAIGSSYTTMGLLMPLFIPLTYALLSAQADVQPAVDDPLMLSTIGAILAGAIFGDHCSPISDTTVLSSAGAGCDHLRHVATQLPYALSVGTIAILCGTLPAGYGVSCWLTLPAGLVAVFLVVRLLGRRADVSTGAD